MIATCPACGKRYRLADDAVPAGGRTVRCAACGHGWTALPGGTAATLAGAAVSSEVPVPSMVGADGASSRAPAAAGPALHDATDAPPEPPRADDATKPRRIGWLAAIFALLAIAVLGVVEFAPESTFDPPRLGLPAPRLPLADLGSLSLPTLPDLPPLDLTRVPLIGDRLDRLVNPPTSPLRIVARGERHPLTGGRLLLTISGSVANPTGAPVALGGIDATLADPTGRVALRWRIAAPASVIGAHGSAAFETTAANFPTGATILRLRPR